MFRTGEILLLTGILFSHVAWAEVEDMESLQRQATALYKEGQFTAAKDAYQRILESEQDNADVLEQLAKITLWENHADEAIELFQRAYDGRGWLSRRWPLSAELSARMASAYYRKNDFAQAAHWYDKAAGPVAIGSLKALSAFATQAEAVSKRPAYQMSGPDVSVIRFIRSEPLPVVEMMVNGQGPYNFFIDTGGAEVILTESLARELDVSIVGGFDTDGFAGSKKGHVGLGLVESIQLGELKIENLPIHTLKLHGIDMYFDLPIHGAIGTRLFMQFVTTMDYAHGQLVLRQKNETSQIQLQKLADHARSIPIWLIDMHQIMARGRLNQMPTGLFFVDTGLAGSGFLASEEVCKKAGVEVDWSGSQIGTGGGGEMVEVDVSIERLSLGEGENEVVRHNLSGKSHQNIVGVLRGSAGFQVAGIISHSFFRDTALTFDFERMQLLIEE